MSFENITFILVITFTFFWFVMTLFFRDRNREYEAVSPYLQSLYLLALILFFYLNPSINKLHLLWATPITFLVLPMFVSNFKTLGYVALFFIFIKLALHLVN